MTPFEVLSLIVSAIGVGGIYFAATQIKINRQQLFLATITKCIADFRDLGELKKDTNDPIIVSRYVDLVSEELFYFQHEYLPDQVSKEWIDGIIDYVPSTDGSGKILNAEYCIKYIANNRANLFHNFPRIQSAFEIRKAYDFKLIYSNDEGEREPRVRERRKVVNEILENISRFSAF